MNARLLAARLRRLPIATPRPVCPACGVQWAPSAFTADGICRMCEAERATDMALYLTTDLRPDGT